MQPERINQLTEEVKKDFNGNTVSEKQFKYEPINFHKNFLWMQQTGIQTDVENPFPAFAVLVGFVALVVLMLFLAPYFNLK